MIFIIVSCSFLFLVCRAALETDTCDDLKGWASGLLYTFLISSTFERTRKILVLIPFILCVMVSIA